MRTCTYLGAVSFDGVYLCRDLVDEEDSDEPGFAPDVTNRRGRRVAGPARPLLKRR